ncbi:putative two-component system sensor protein [Indibacter alkaliphilus LW1]|uniref:Two-component system sensor protein n=1 Tax=Indibacter alkaliphilus (strain CCUG 57479 / KCTC 22604 / LW1) TaxID=1189612 RepID=S2E2G4_INDAL|nr:histidine kinase [Indibacter alkaliphilus]EOZ98661.1 putative two-component system sensor protein [Indibacter alkaliphilus LW1]
MTFSAAIHLENSGLLKKLLKLKFHHFLFWGFYFVFWVWVYRSMYSQLSDLLWVTGFYTVANASIYYISYYILIPKIFKPKGIFLFILSFLMLGILLALLMYFGIQWILVTDLKEFFQASFVQILMIYFSSNIFTGAILLGFKGFVDNRKMQRINELKEKERVASELEFLKSQVNPHFLFNAINSVYVLIRMDPEKASDTLIKLSNLLRSQLYDFSVNKIDILKELEYLENYIDLEKIRKGERMDIDYQVIGNLEGFKIAPLVLIPFLENCFKHLSSHVDKKNMVKLHLSKRDNQLMAYFFNTKDESGFDKRPGGLGLKNIKRRLEILYPKNYTLTIKEEKDTFEVWLTLNID